MGAVPLAHWGPTVPAADRAVARPERARLVAFAALGLFGALHWGALIRPARGGDMLLALLFALAGAAALIAIPAAASDLRRRLMVTAVAVALLVLEAAAVVAVWLLYARVRDGRSRLPLAFAAAVAGFLAFTKVFSPQYLVWLVPLVVLAGSSAAVALTAASLLLAQAWFFHYHALFRLAWPVWLLVVRDLLVVAVFVTLAAALAPGQPWRSKIRIPSRSKTSRHSGLRRSQESWTAAGRGANRSA